MKGRNARRQRDKSEELQMHEVFYTIQGEGPFQGEPAVFMRLTGCNLACEFCDTEWDDDRDEYKHPDDWAEIARDKADCKTDLVVLTGGEPLRQEIGMLIDALWAGGFDRFQIETAGSFYQPILERNGVTTVISPKTSIINNKIRTGNIDRYWKYILRAGEIDAEDGLPTAPTQRIKPDSDFLGGGAPARPNFDEIIFVNPCDDMDEEKNRANRRATAQSALNFGYRAGLQMHKFFGIP